MFGRMLITDFSGVYRDEGFTGSLSAAGFDWRLLDLSGIEGTKCYCSEEAAGAIRMALDQEEEYKVHWIDSGDYHYMTFLFCERIRTPFSLILFDHHPDDQEPAFGNVLSCGGWVAALRRENPFLRDVISVGVDGVFPCPSVCQGPFYVSLDKDVFSPAYARTDWSQGSSAPEDVFRFLDGVVSGPGEILGMDICGELPVRNGGKPEDLLINLETNMFIANKLKTIFL